MSWISQPRISLCILWISELWVWPMCLSLLWVLHCWLCRRSQEYICYKSHRVRMLLFTLRICTPWVSLYICAPWICLTCISYLHLIDFISLMYLMSLLHGCNSSGGRSGGNTWYDRSEIHFNQIGAEFFPEWGHLCCVIFIDTLTVWGSS